MRIISYEIKKLLNWKVLVLVFLISLLFVELFIRFEFEHFPNGRPMGDGFKISQQMIEKYGQEMDETEFQDFKNTYQEEIVKAEAYLREEGVSSYEQFRNHGGYLADEIMFEKGVDLFWELQAREGIIEDYERRKEAFTLYTEDIDNSAWKEDIITGTSLNSILPYIVYENYNNLISRLAVLIMVSVMIVTGRVFITDTKNNAMSLQYSTLTGRKLFKYKTMASLITALLLTTIYVGVFLIAYRSNDTSAFLHSSLHSYENLSYIFWVDMSFLKYIILTIAGVYLLALVSASVTTYLSRAVSNYFSLIGSQVPVVVILIILVLQYLISDLFSVRYPMWLTLGTYVVLLIIGTMLLVLRWKKEKRLDIG